eukprot:5854954-Prymnesium_polylepis.1
MGIHGAPKRWAIRFCMLLQLEHHEGMVTLEPNRTLDPNPEPNPEPSPNPALSPAPTQEGMVRLVPTP